MNLEDSTPGPGDSTPEPEKGLKPASPSGSRAPSPQRGTSRGRTGQGKRPSSPPVQEKRPSSPSVQEKALESASGPRDESQSYQTFKVQFLLDERNAVRRTEITHVESGKLKNLSGYDREGILAVLDAYVRPAAEQGSAAERDSRKATVPADAIDERPTADIGEEGKVRGEALEAATVTFHTPPSTLVIGKPATLYLTIDMGSASAAGERASDYQYRALISAKPVPGGPWQKIGTSSGSLTGQATTTIEVPVAPQPPEG